METPTKTTQLSNVTDLDFSFAFSYISRIVQYCRSHTFYIMHYQVITFVNISDCFNRQGFAATIVLAQCIQVNGIRASGFHETSFSNFTTWQGYSLR
ncbi:hypothetical protein D3C80_1794650 [compost metagenome]